MATIICAPQPTIIWKVGPMVLTYGGITITFEQCTADKIKVTTDSRGRQTWAVQILDRRWKWKECGRISGYYNVRRGSEDIIEDTEKTPRELATLCLEALDETNFDVEALPEEPRPEIEWDYTLPAEALAKVCDLYGCRVVLGLDNRIKIVVAGVGADLQIDDLATQGDVEPDPPERPDALIFTAARTRFQFDFTLEAVGLDFISDFGDVAIKPIDELSYAPAPEPGIVGSRPWDVADPPYFDQVSILIERELAIESVYRWYRIVTPFTLIAGEETYSIEDLDRILPIENVQIEKHRVLGREEPRPAWVHGIFCPDLDSTDPLEPGQQPDNRITTKFPKSFSIDKAKGIVKFSEAVYRMHKTFKSGTFDEVLVMRPAELRLRTTVSLREEDTRGWIREERRRDMPPPLAGTRPKYIVRDDIAFESVATYLPQLVDNDLGEIDDSDHSFFTNEVEVDDQANYYLDAEEKEYQFTAPASIQYAGFVPIVPDGAIQQVTWTVDGAGFARTKASRNREDLQKTLPFKERRRIEIEREEAKKEQETRRQTQSKHNKAQA
jgi:hypothetical protein